MAGSIPDQVAVATQQPLWQHHGPADALYKENTFEWACVRYFEEILNITWSQQLI